MSASPGNDSLIDRYLVLGLRLGRHIDGFVDAYFGPAGLSELVAGEPVAPASRLRSEAAELLVDLDSGIEADVIDASRRRWLRAQVVGLHTSARKLSGETIAGHGDVLVLLFDADPAAAHFVSNGCRRAGAEERIKDEIAGVGGYMNNSMKKSLRLWSLEWLNIGH